MDNRFTFKDFVFAVLLVVVIAALGITWWKFGYQEERINDVRFELRRLNDATQQQILVLNDIRKSLKNGVAVSATQSSAESQPSGIIRRKNADGGIYVYYPEPPKSPHDPQDLPNYAPGDWLVRNLGSEPSVITPYIDRDAYGGRVQAPVLETLITQNPETFEFEPLLAESYEFFPKTLTYRFTLRKNINFSDGTPITVKDVLFSYNTIMTKGLESDRAQSYLRMIESVTQSGERSVDIKFKEPYFKALEVAGAFFEIIPEHIYRFKTADEYNRRTDLLVGSGPYVFEKHNWVRGQQIVLVRNEKYWGDRPTYDRVVFKFIANPQAGFQAFQNDEIDYVEPQADQYEKFAKDPEFVKTHTIYAIATPAAGYLYVGWNQRNPIFKDKLTRQALTELIDRDALIKTIQRDLSYPITGPFSPMVPQCDQSLKPWPYDPESAKAKLAQAGWKLNKRGVLERDGVEFKFNLMIPSQRPDREAHAVYIKEQFAKVGIDVSITPFEFSVLVDRLDNRDFDAVMLRWTGGIEGDPYQIWHSDSIKDKGSNYIGFSNPQADKLIDAGRRELDEAKRMEIWHQLHRLIYEEQPYAFLHAQKELTFIQTRFENTKPYKIGLNTYDWFVPAPQQKYR